jgi:hypothetical protein
MDCRALPVCGISKQDDVLFMVDGSNSTIEGITRLWFVVTTGQVGPRWSIILVPIVGPRPSRAVWPTGATLACSPAVRSLRPERDRTAASEV